MKKILMILAVLVAFSANAQQMSKKEFSNLKKKAESGDFVSSCEYAYAVFAGVGCKSDEKAGMEMLRQLMEQYPDSGYVSYYLGCANLIGSEADTTMAIVYFNRGADQGNTNSMNVLGQSYLFGDFTEVDDSRAHSYFERAVALNSPNGNYWMGCMLYRGLGCDFSPAEAMPFLQKAYSMKVPNAARMLGDIYSKGDPAMQVEMDRAKAAECYLNGIRWGALYLYGDLAQLYREAGDTNQADLYYRKAFEAGDIEACYDVENMYYKGENWAKCLEWSQLGDKAGSKNCSRVLGALYEYGYGVKPDAAKAARYYEKDTTYWSYSHLGHLYYEGKLCKKMDQQHFDKGVEYLSLASELGDAYATLTLAETYNNGCEYAEADAAKAVYYYNKLAENDYHQGLFYMGQFYEVGYGVEQDTVKALAYMRQAAEQQNPMALCYMGDYYRSGHLVGYRDLQQSFDYYKAAADQGSEAGYYLVGRTYLEQGDTLAAIPYLKVAANNNVHQAADRLGDLYNYGSIELIPNGDSALHYYLMAAQQNNPHSCYVIGRQLLHEENPEMAVMFLSNGSQGSDSAMVLLGRCLVQGIGVKKADPVAAYHLFQKASSYQNAEAYYMMGAFNMNGLVGMPEEALAKSYFDTAASLGNTDAMLQLVYCYEGEIGCDYDHASAISWLRRAASLDNVRAINHLIDLYAEGDELVEKDEKKAFELAKYGADTLGSLASLCKLGAFYQEGVGCVLNSAKAVECFTKAADAGSAEAMFLLAAYYDRDLYVEGDEDDVHIEGDPVLSFEWLKKAADAGHVESMYYLGSLYETGNSVVKADKKLAKKYYKMAADQGMSSASAALNRMGGK